MESAKTPGRGRDVVEAALIEAAVEVLAEQGPARTSVRDIAERAGVNKGQIHHYFGGKQGLIEAAVRHLARDHYEKSVARGEGGYPMPLTLGLDQQYVQTITRLILDGDLETASVEFEDGVGSVPRDVLHRLTETRDLEAPDIDLKSLVAVGLTLEMGWAAFESFILRAVDADADEAEIIRKHVKEHFYDLTPGRSVD